MASLARRRAGVRLKEEVADVLIYALLLAHETGIDPEQAVRAKLAANNLKYPVEKSRGSNTKYNEL
jgi:NTP pyrophosphatase (non-canonical NTP hydrolase)